MMAAMKVDIIGIAGGTGAGKSTICFKVMGKHPDKISFVHLDDYHNKTKAPMLHGFVNLDHPEGLNFDQLLRDLRALKRGQNVTVQTKNERFNPKAKEIGRLPMVIESKPVVLLEGYLALWQPMIRALLSDSIFLELDYFTRIKRRTKFMDNVYQEKVLVPMHQLFVEPSKSFANHIVDVSGMTVDTVVEGVEEILLPYLLEES